MKNVGIIRKIDNLGRIVLPKELRKTLNVNNGDDFQITIDDEKIILEKYSKLENFEDIVYKIISCFSYVLKYDIYFTINDKIINNNSDVLKSIENIILERKLYYVDKVEKISISNNIEKDGKIVVLPVVYNSDLLGSIIIIGNDKIDNLIKNILLTK